MISSLEALHTSQGLGAGFRVSSLSGLGFRVYWGLGFRVYRA